MKNCIAAVILSIGATFASHGVAMDIGNGIEPDGDYLVGFILLGADYRKTEPETGAFARQSSWHAVSKDPLKFQKPEFDTSVTIIQDDVCKYQLKYESKDVSGAVKTKDIEVDFREISNIELVDTGIGMWALEGTGATFWCEKISKKGMNWSDCNSAPRNDQGRIQLFLNGGARDRDISTAYRFFFNNTGCVIR